MSKKLENLSRVYHELLDRYGPEDLHVQSLRTDLDVLESVEFRRPSRPAPKSFQSRTTGNHRRQASNLNVGAQTNLLH
ncbi:hypothetical protein MCEMSEM18_01660 [Comamonadaceae bacterium]